MSPRQARIRDFFDRAAPQYRRKDNLFKQFYFRQRMSLALAQFRPEDRRVLDVGCGRGALYGLLLDQYPQLDFVGLDISPEMLRLGRIPPEKRRESTLEAYAAAHPAETFDHVFALGLTTYYSPDRLPAFYAALHQLLVTDGRATVSYTHSGAYDFGLRNWLNRYFGNLLPANRSLSRDFSIYAATPQEVAGSLPPGLSVVSIHWLPASIPLLSQLAPALSVWLAQGWLHSWSQRWRGDFIVNLRRVD